MSVSEAILSWCHCNVCGLNRTIEHGVNLNVTWLGFAFVLISFVHIHGVVVVAYFVGEGWGVRLKLDVQGRRGVKISDVDRQGLGGGGRGAWKLDNFREVLFIIPNVYVVFYYEIPTFYQDFKNENLCFFKFVPSSCR